MVRYYKSRRRESAYLLEATEAPRTGASSSEKKSRRRHSQSTDLLQVEEDQPIAIAIGGPARIAGVIDYYKER